MQSNRSRWGEPKAKDPGLESVNASVASSGRPDFNSRGGSNAQTSLHYVSQSSHADKGSKNHPLKTSAIDAEDSGREEGEEGPEEEGALPDDNGQTSSRSTLHYHYHETDGGGSGGRFGRDVSDRGSSRYDENRYTSRSSTARSRSPKGQRRRRDDSSSRRHNARDERDASSRRDESIASNGRRREIRDRADRFRRDDSNRERRRVDSVDRVERHRRGGSPPDNNGRRSERASGVDEKAVSYQMHPKEESHRGDHVRQGSSARDRRGDEYADRASRHMSLEGSHRRTYEDKRGPSRRRDDSPHRTDRRKQEHYSETSRRQDGSIDNKRRITERNSSERSRRRYDEGSEREVSSSRFVTDEKKDFNPRRSLASRKSRSPERQRRHSPKSVRTSRSIERFANSEEPIPKTGSTALPPGAFIKRVEYVTSLSGGSNDKKSLHSQQGPSAFASSYAGAKHVSYQEHASDSRQLYKFERTADGTYRPSKIKETSAPSRNPWKTMPRESATQKNSPGYLSYLPNGARIIERGEVLSAPGRGLRKDTGEYRCATNSGEMERTQSSSKARVSGSKERIASPRLSSDRSRRSRGDDDLRKTHRSKERSSSPRRSLAKSHHRSVEKRSSRERSKVEASSSSPSRNKEQPKALSPERVVVGTNEGKGGFLENKSLNSSEWLGTRERIPHVSEGKESSRFAEGSEYRWRYSEARYERDMSHHVAEDSQKMEKERDQRSRNNGPNGDWRPNDEHKYRALHTRYSGDSAHKRNVEQNDTTQVKVNYFSEMVEVGKEVCEGPLEDKQKRTSQGSIDVRNTPSRKEVAGNHESREAPDTDSGKKRFTDTTNGAPTIPLKRSAPLGDQDKSRDKNVRGYTTSCNTGNERPTKRSRTSSIDKTETESSKTTTPPLKNEHSDVDSQGAEKQSTSKRDERKEVVREHSSDSYASYTSNAERPAKKSKVSASNQDRSGPTGMASIPLKKEYAQVHTLKQSSERQSDEDNQEKQVDTAQSQGTGLMIPLKKEYRHLNQNPAREKSRNVADAPMRKEGSHRKESGVIDDNKNVVDPEEDEEGEPVVSQKRSTTLRYGKVKVRREKESSGKVSKSGKKRQRSSKDESPKPRDTRDGDGGNEIEQSGTQYLHHASSSSEHEEPQPSEHAGDEEDLESGDAVEERADVGLSTLEERNKNSGRSYNSSEMSVDGKVTTKKEKSPVSLEAESDMSQQRPAEAPEPEVLKKEGSGSIEPPVQIGKVMEGELSEEHLDEVDMMEDDTYEPNRLRAVANRLEDIRNKKTARKQQVRASREKCQESMSVLFSPRSNALSRYISFIHSTSAPRKADMLSFLTGSEETREYSVFSPADVDASWKGIQEESKARSVLSNIFARPESSNMLPSAGCTLGAIILGKSRDGNKCQQDGRLSPHDILQNALLGKVLVPLPKKLTNDNRTNRYRLPVLCQTYLANCHSTTHRSMHKLSSFHLERILSTSAVSKASAMNRAGVKRVLKAKYERRKTYQIAAICAQKVARRSCLQRQQRRKGIQDSIERAIDILDGKNGDSSGGGASFMLSTGDASFSETPFLSRTISAGSQRPMRTASAMASQAIAASSKRQKKSLVRGSTQQDDRTEVEELSEDMDGLQSLYHGNSYEDGNMLPSTHSKSFPQEVSDMRLLLNSRGSPLINLGQNFEGDITDLNKESVGPEAITHNLKPFGPSSIRLGSIFPFNEQSTDDVGNRSFVDRLMGCNSHACAVSTRWEMPTRKFKETLWPSEPEGASSPMTPLGSPSQSPLSSSGQGSSARFWNTGIMRSYSDSEWSYALDAITSRENDANNNRASIPRMVHRVTATSGSMPLVRKTQPAVDQALKPTNLILRAVLRQFSEGQLGFQSNGTKQKHGNFHMGSLLACEELSAAHHISECGAISMDGLCTSRHCRNTPLWRDIEKIIFFEKFLLYSKDFECIASYLPEKSYQDCAAFYYDVKHQAGLKEASRKLISSMRSGLGMSAFRIAVECAVRIGVYVPERLLRDFAENWSNIRSVTEYIPEWQCSPMKYHSGPYDSSELAEGCRIRDRFQSDQFPLLSQLVLSYTMDDIDDVRGSITEYMSAKTCSPHEEDEDTSSSREVATQQLVRVLNARDSLYYYGQNQYYE